MVKKILNYFHKEFSGLHQAALLLAFASISADILALARDRLFAATFGAGRELDVYFAAFRVPDLIYTFTLLFAANTALIPILLKKSEVGEEEARRFFGGMMTVFVAFTIVLAAAAFVFMPVLAKVIAPGFQGADGANVVLLGRIMLLSPILLGFSNLVSSVVQSYRRFFVYALSPLFYNLGIILGVAVFYPVLGIAGLAWGVALGAFLHLGIQLPSIMRLGFMPRFSLHGLSADIRETIILSFPRTIGLSLNQLVAMVVTALASLLTPGSIAVFNLAQNLQSVPLSVVGLSYSVAAFPTLARFFVNNQREEFISGVATALRHIILWSLPVSVLFIVLRAQIVRVVLGAGAFSWTDTRLTAAAFLLFSFSILAQGITMLLVRALYAAGRTTLPLIINFFSSAVTIVLSLWLTDVFISGGALADFLLRGLRVQDVAGTAVLALPLAISLGAILNSLILLLSFDYLFDTRVLKKYLQPFFEIVLASVLGGFTAYLALQVGALFFDLNTFFGIFLQGAIAGLLGAAIIAAVLRFFCNREFMEVWEALHKRFWRAAVIASEPESIK